VGQVGNLRPIGNRPAPGDRQSPHTNGCSFAAQVGDTRPPLWGQPNLPAAAFSAGFFIIFAAALALSPAILRRETEETFFSHRFLNFIFHS